MIHYIKGDITTSDCDFICHQVNCKGKMNSGVAKAIREKWPQVYDNYKSKCDERKEAIYNTTSSFEFMPDWSETLLGDIQICALYDDYFKADKHQHVVNLFAQYTYGYDNKQYTSYDAFWQCLNNLKQCVSEDATIAFPYKVGCVRGGASWNIIKTMIKEVFKDREIYFYFIDNNILDDDDKIEYMFINHIGMVKGAEWIIHEQENN